mgnify:CR=1 FL=1
MRNSIASALPAAKVVDAYANIESVKLFSQGRHGNWRATGSPDFQFQYRTQSAPYGDLLLPDITPNPLPHFDADAPRGRHSSLALFLASLDRVEALGSLGWKDSVGVSARWVSEKDVIFRAFGAYGGEGWRFGATGAFPF